MRYLVNIEKQAFLCDTCKMADKKLEKEFVKHNDYYELVFAQGLL